jgi:hypothetical protein
MTEARFLNYPVDAHMAKPPSASLQKSDKPNAVVAIATPAYSARTEGSAVLIKTAPSTASKGDEDGRS